MISNFCLGQFYHCDPYQYVGDWGYYMEFDKNYITQNGIGDVEVWVYFLEEDSRRVTDSALNYRVFFNEQGLPIRYQSDWLTPVGGWTKFKRKIGLEKVKLNELEYQFEYDSLNKLIHVTEVFSESHGDGSYFRTDIFHKYDEQGRLAYQHVEDKVIYPPGFKYLGANYPNDTLNNYFWFNYKGDTLTTVYRNNSESLANKIIDTLTFNCTFDSVFMKRLLGPGIELDSLNRIKKETVFSMTAKVLGADCIYIESENDIIYTYYYNEQGKEARVESHLRSGEHLSTRYFDYENGTIKKVWSSNTLLVTRYKYHRL